MLKNEDIDRRDELCDAVTPRHAHLCGRYKRSCAYHELQFTLPIMLTETIDDLLKYKGEIFAKYGEGTKKELKAIVGQLSKLRYQLQTNKPFEKIGGNESDCHLWNDFIRNLSDDLSTFYQSPWVYTECYVYRKVASFFQESTAFKDFDYFGKRKTFQLTYKFAVHIARHLRQAKKDYKTFEDLLKLNLWSNRLQEFLKDDNNESMVFWDMINAWDNNIIINNITLVWKCLEEFDPSNSKIVDIVCDNGGFDLYMDIVLAEYLIDKQMAKEIRFHLKPIPWYVVNATVTDFNNIINFIRRHKSPFVCEQGRKWKQYLDNGKFSIATMDYFWTSPYEYFRMREINVNLYNYLSKANLIIFKGDLHYRKLIGDYVWDATEEFLTCIRGFLPSNLCAMRVLKSDIVCGFPIGKAEELQRIDAKWMTSGEYAVVQFEEVLECGCRLKNIST